MSEDNTSWADPWDYPINPVYDTVTGELIGAADVPGSVPYWVTDGEIPEDSIQKRDNDSWSFMTYSNTPSGSQSDLDTVSLDPLGLPKSHHWESERFVAPPIHLVLFLFFIGILYAYCFPSISLALNLQLYCRGIHRVTTYVVISRPSSEMKMLLQIGRIGSAGRSLSSP